MPIPKNAISDLLKTAQEKEAPEVYCPKCGSHLSFLLPHSVVPILSPDALVEANLYLAGNYRSWLDRIASLLSRVNIGVKDRDRIPDPLVKDEIARRHLNRMRVAGGGIAFGGEKRKSADDEAIKKFRSDGIHRTDNVSSELHRLGKLLEERVLDSTFQEKVKPVSALEELVESRKEGVDMSPVADALELVLLQLEAADYFAVLTDIVLCQPNVMGWLQSTKRECSENGVISVDSLVKKLKPLSDPAHCYMWDCLKLLGKSIQDNLGWKWLTEGTARDWGTGEGSREKMWNRWERACFLVALLTMHKTEEGRAILDKHFSSSYGTRGSSMYMLPQLTVLTYRQMIDLLTSAEVVRYNWFGLYSDYRMYLDKIKLKDESKEKSEDNDVEGAAFELFTKSLEDEKFQAAVRKLCGFACTGPASTVLEFVNSPSQRQDGAQVDSADLLSNFCGWYPKHYPSYSIVLLGTPGSGKSFAFLSGGTILDYCLRGLEGFSVHPDDPRTDFQISRLDQMFTRGRKPGRTDRNHHHALSWRLAPISTEEKDEIGFVFVDIPGEKATLEQREGNIDPIVFNTLCRANIVMVFLDLNTDSKFSPRFISGPYSKEFERFNNAREEAWKDRKVPVNGQHAGRENIGRNDNQGDPDEDMVQVEILSNLDAGQPNQANKTQANNGEFDLENLANLDQFQFVKRMADRCYHLRSGKNPPHFLVVLPKCDLYLSQDAKVEEGNDETVKSCFFLHALFDQLRQEQVLYLEERSPEENKNFGDLTSRGGISWRGIGLPSGTSTELAQTTVESQRKLVCEISKRLIDASGSMGSVVSKDPTRHPEARKWNQAIPILAKELENAFGKERVLFLPISAQGRQPEGQDDNRQAEKAWPQKLCEFIFLAPMMIGADEFKKARAEFKKGDETTTTDEVPSSTVPGETKSHLSNE